MKTSPLLFSLLINDLESYLDETNNQCIDLTDEICNKYLKVTAIMYADDTMLLSNSKGGLQNGLDDLYSYCK